MNKIVEMDPASVGLRVYSALHDIELDDWLYKYHRELWVEWMHTRVPPTQWLQESYPAVWVEWRMSR